MYRSEEIPEVFQGQCKNIGILSKDIASGGGERWESFARADSQVGIVQFALRPCVP